MLAPLLVLSVAAVVLSVPRSVPRTSALPSGRNLKYQDDSLQQRRVRAHDYSCIARGQVFVAPSWLDDELLRALRADARALLCEGSIPDMDEPIGKRLKLELYTRSWRVPGEANPSDARAAARRLFDKLRIELENVVDRSLIMDEIGAQTTYSCGKVGEPIYVHMDSVHEAFAFTGFHAGFDLDGYAPTRRSLGWLLYLSDDDWDDPGGDGSGGNLLAYPRHDSHGKVGAHKGNLQVGWLDRGNCSQAVFLDSWVLPEWMEGRTLSELRQEWAGQYEDDGELWLALYNLVQPSYQLYCIGTGGEREDLSKPCETPARDENGDYPEDLPSLRDMLPESLQASFSSTLCGAHPKQHQVRVSPKGGTLVIFDSAVVPHEVTKVVAGERLALFGFFAEERVVPAAWADPDGATSPCGPWFHAGWAFLDDEITIYELPIGQSQ